MGRGEMDNAWRSDCEGREGDNPAPRGVGDSGSPGLDRKKVGAMGFPGGKRIYEPPSPGDRFGKLTVVGLERGPLGGVRAVLCRCDCGNTLSTKESHLHRGLKRWCINCSKGKYAATRKKRGHRYANICPDDEHRTRLLNRISSIQQRCHNPKAQNWESYGKRGITVWPEWRKDRGAFLAYLLTLPGWDDPVLELDRIDNNRGYEPGNLRFISRRDNANNRRTVRDLQQEVETLRQEVEALRQENADLRSRLVRAEAALRDLEQRGAAAGS